MQKADFERIVREHESMVYSIAYYFFHNTALAEEIAQDVFLRLYRVRPALQSHSHEVAWLRQATRHRCIDLLRHRSIRNEVQYDTLPDVAGDSTDADPLLHEKLRRLVASLPETPRMVIILRYGEDMNVQEIADTLGMPVRTVWSHLQRGLALLREKAARYLREEVHERTGK